MTEPTTWTLRLPWTKPPLSLNDRYLSRGGHQRHNRIIREVRKTARDLAEREGIPPCPRIHVQLFYVPRANRHRDADNLIATAKPLVDGLRDARVVHDDDPRYVSWSPPRLEPAQPKDPHLYLVITRLDTQETP